MGPLLVAMLAVLFFAFAAVSASVGFAFALLAFWHFFGGRSRLLGFYVLGSAILGSLTAVLFGIGMQWNVVGHAIMKEPMLGYTSWAAVGFGWSAAAAFGVGSLIRWLFLPRSA